MKSVFFLLALALSGGIVTAVISAIRPSLLSLLITNGEWKSRHEFRFLSFIYDLLPNSTFFALLTFEIIDTIFIVTTSILLVSAASRYTAELRLIIVKRSILKMKNGDTDIEDHISAIKTYADTFENFIKFSSVSTIIAFLQLLISLFVVWQQSIYSFYLIASSILIFMISLYFYGIQYTKLTKRKFDADNNLLKGNSLGIRKGRDIFYGGKKSLWFSKRLKEIFLVARTHTIVGSFEGVFHSGTVAIVNFWILLGFYILIMHHSLPMEYFITYVLYLGLVMGPVMKVSSFVSELQQFNVARRMLKSYLMQSNHTNLSKYSFFPVSLSSTSFEPNTFVISKNQKIALNGPSGAGKTTILEAILGLRLLPIINRIPLSIENKNKERVFYLSDTPPFEAGKVMQNLGVSLSEAVYFARRFHLFDDKNDQELILFLNRDIEKNGEPFSLGERQRLQLLSILSANPSVLLLDEALSGISEDMEHNIISALLDISYLTIIYVGHRSAIKRLFNNSVEIRSIN